ncbi:GNAT family N-acetyltransferase [Candidatus Bipolaricaulota bacterium]|nr:GNAT family N-acetyltransferase [Candidatus Bipolaricaulota bacterium]
MWEEAGLPFKPNGRDQRERLAREIEGPCSIFLVAEDAGELVGAILGTHDGRKGWINRLAISPRHRRQGIASVLVAAVKERLSARDIEIFAGQIEDWNEASMIFFEDLGYIRHDDIIYYTKRKNPEV